MLPKLMKLCAITGSRPAGWSKCVVPTKAGQKLKVAVECTSEDYNAVAEVVVAGDGPGPNKNFYDERGNDGCVIRSIVSA